MGCVLNTCAQGNNGLENMDEIITTETVLSEIENGDTDWAATHLDELFEAGEIDRVTYARIERALEAAESA